MSFADPREFAPATGEAVTITMDDGRVYRGRVTLVRSTAEPYGLRQVETEIQLFAPAKDDGRA